MVNLTKGVVEILGAGPASLAAALFIDLLINISILVS